MPLCKVYANLSPIMQKSPLSIHVLERLAEWFRADSHKQLLLEFSPFHGLTTRHGLLLCDAPSNPHFPAFEIGGIHMRFQPA